MTRAMKKILTTVILACVVFGAIFAFSRTREWPTETSGTDNPSQAVDEGGVPEVSAHEEGVEELSSLSIRSLRRGTYPGGDFTIEQDLPNGTNYRQAIVSYRSEGLKIFGLLTTPLAPRPPDGHPSVVFVHGYIPPKEYSTTGNYPTYQATLARGGFVTFKPDLRGHGNSEGEAVSAHTSEKYVVDTLNAISFMKNHPDIDPKRIGYWGHSNGGEIGLRVAVVSPDIRAFVLWAGVVGSYTDMLETYNDKIPFLRDVTENPLVQSHGLPGQNPEFWNKIDPYFFLSDVTAPVQLHHGTRDASVPIELSLQLKKALENAEKEVEYFAYDGDDHNIGNNSGLAWQRSIRFFRDNL